MINLYLGRRQFTRSRGWPADAMRWLGHNLTILGLLIPPLGIVLQLANVVSLGQMLTMLVAAVCLFGIGRIVEGYGR